jgi:hypothetical membrane protein
MQPETRLLFGPVAAAIFVLGVLGLALLVPGYSHIHQSISEIGEVGSPARVPFAIMLFCYAGCLLFFASGIRRVAMRARRSQLAAYLVGFNALTQMGIAIFASPHPFHNIFGLASMIGVQAPLALALEWRRDSGARALVTASWILFIILWVTLILNLSELFPHSNLWLLIQLVSGLAQRAAAAVWLTWCAVAGSLMWQRERRAQKTTVFS